MRLTLVGIYPKSTMAKYLLAPYTLKAYLDLHTGHHTEVLNFPEDVDPYNAAMEIIKTDSDCIGYSCYTWNMDRVLKISDHIAGTLPNELQVFGGPEIVEPLRPYGIWIKGEGEEQLRCLLEYGYHMGMEPVLDTLPSPYLNGTIPRELFRMRQAWIETQRGCRFKCKYCVYHKGHAEINYIDMNRIKDELYNLIKIHRVRAIRFTDGTFTSDIKRAKIIADHLLWMKGLVAKLPWIWWEITNHGVDNEFLSMLAKLKNKPVIENCKTSLSFDTPQMYNTMLKNYTVVNSFGIQSLNKEALKAVGRFKVRDLGGFLRKVNKHNLAFKLDMILGLPRETFQSYWAGIAELLPYIENTDHILNIHRLQILPGSELEDEAANHGVVTERESHYVIATYDFPAGQLQRAAQMTAVLFRVINSPLRPMFFKKIKNNGLLALLQRLLVALYKGPAWPTDEYWNGQIFKDIKTQDIKEYLK